MIECCAARRVRQYIYNARPEEPCLFSLVLTSNDSSRIKVERAMGWAICCISEINMWHLDDKLEGCPRSFKSSVLQVIGAVLKIINDCETDVTEN